MEYIEILVKLRKIIRSINLESKKVEKQFGISIPQLLILQFLSKQDDYKTTAKDIKGYINLNASTVSGILSRLEVKGLIAKSPKPNDKRTIYIVLTAKGADLLVTSPTTLQEKISKKLKQLSPKKIEELNDSIEFLTNLMEAENIEAAPIITNKDFTTHHTK